MVRHAKAILRQMNNANKELVREFASLTNKPIVLCCENSFKQYEGVNVEFEDITEFLDSLNHLPTQVEFLYNDISSRSRLVKMLINRKINYFDDEEVYS